MFELESNGFNVREQMPIKVYYEGILVGEYFADLVVENKVIVELKAATTLCEEHEVQLLNYLKATEFEVGLLLNFGKIPPEVKRKIFTHQGEKLQKYNDNADTPGYRHDL